MKSPTKRRFLNALLLSSSLAFMPTVFANDASGMSYDNGLKSWSTLQGEQLEPLVGQSFSIYGQEASCVVTLEVLHLGPEDPGRPAELVRKRSFTAKFVPMWEGVCLQGDQLAGISHPDIMGDGSVFVMAKVDDKDKPFLEIVFN